jgi:hypothetical protein
MYPFAHFTANYFQQYIPENNRNLVITFIIVFSRFEYALKAEGLINGSPENVSANWDSFAGTLREQFQPGRTPSLQAAVDYLHNSPPRKQIIQGDNRLGWSSSRNSGNTPLIHELLLSIRTIRNNLFHGAKFQEIFHENHIENRNQQLLQSSLIVLDECLRLSPQVQSAFFAEIPRRNWPDIEEENND